MQTKTNKTTLFTNGLIWFGAGISMAEIVTGTYLASLGFGQGMLANLIGHIIGCILLFFAGVIGAKERVNSMDSVKMSFGSKGGLFFGIMNVIQLIGWTGIMIFNASVAMSEIAFIPMYVWCIIIGVGICIWIYLDVKNMKMISAFAMFGLFVLTIFVSVIVFKDITNYEIGMEALKFGSAVELAVAMPISWIPLISDYTKDAKRPVLASGISAGVYGVVSFWMFTIGIGMALYTNEDDIAMILSKAGFGLIGLIIIIFSTVTTTYLDAFSAGISAKTIYKKVNSKIVGMIITVIGVVFAIFLPLNHMENFLYLIGSIFAPMIAILFTDYFILKKAYKVTDSFDILNSIIWVIGFIVYRILMNYDLLLGNTLLDILITMSICYFANISLQKISRHK